MTSGTEIAGAGGHRRLAPLLLVAVVVATYAPSLAGGFINYDDPWLIERNRTLKRPDAGAIATIWADLSVEARMGLGAEYLPVRDTLHWVEARLHGLDPHAMRVLSLALYVAGALLLRAALHRVLVDPRVAEVTAWLFALHPVHAESVAWLAGRKDVLALLFVAGALVAYTGRSRHRLWLVPLLFAFACLSKGVAVVAPLLLPVCDALAGRGPKQRSFWPSLAVGLAALIVHVKVGALVGMATSLPGDSRVATAATMGPVFLRYLGNIVWPAALSVVYDVPVRGASDVLGWLAYLPLLAWGVAGAVLARRSRPLVIVGLAWFLLPLAPTSHVIVPLEHLMADRYLLLAVLGPCALGAAAVLRLPSAGARWAVAGSLVVALGLTTGVRAHVFSDSVRLWRDATEKTSASVVAPYQLAESYRERGRLREAEAAYRDALRRAGPADETGRRAANNLATILAGGGRLAEAEVILREIVVRFPGDPKALNNLAEIVARGGDHTTARALFEDLIRRFPSYQPGKTNLERRYGGPTTGAAPSGTAPRP